MGAIGFTVWAFVSGAAAAFAWFLGRGKSARRDERAKLQKKDADHAGTIERRVDAVRSDPDRMQRDHGKAGYRD
jgi:hypothetical protein